MQFLKIFLVLVCMASAVPVAGGSRGSGKGATTSSDVNAQTLVLKVGEEHKLSMPGGHQIWVQNRKLLAISTRGANLVVTGLAEGKTAAQIGPIAYQIQVIQPVKGALIKAFEIELRQTLGLKRTIANHQVTISGKLYHFADWVRLAEISAALDQTYAMQAEIPAAMQTQAQEYWLRQTEAEGLAPLPVHFGRPLRARVSVGPEAYSKYQEIFGPFGVALQKDRDAIAVAPVVKVQITVAEVRRDFALSYGIRWPSSYQATLLADGQRQFENLVLTANALESKGQGKILASPSLICRSGKSAEFMAGGEFPIKITSYKSQGVLWKKYGVVLKVQPTADTSGRMSIALETEVSTIDSSRTVEGVPGLLTNRISSHFDLSSSRTIVLSGLIKNEEGKAASGLPVLQRIPILGALFSSRDFRENRTELIILVRPSVMSEVSESLESSHPRHLGDIAHDTP